MISLAVALGGFYRGEFFQQWRLEFESFADEIGLLDIIAFWSLRPVVNNILFVGNENCVFYRSIEIINVAGNIRLR